MHCTCAQVHSLANGPEVKNALLETSRKGYLAAMSASSYSFVSMVQVGLAWVAGWVVARRGEWWGGHISGQTAAMGAWNGWVCRWRSTRAGRAATGGGEGPGPAGPHPNTHEACQHACQQLLPPLCVHLQRFGPLMNPGGSVINLTYNASNRIIPGYGGGMSSAKAVSCCWGLRAELM